MDWSNYYRCFNTIKQEIRHVMEMVADNIIEDISDDYGFIGIDKDGNSVELYLIDSGDADDGIYGKHGNIRFAVVGDGGVVKTEVVPYNYTKKCWADYTNIPEFHRRIGLVKEII